MAGVNHPDDTPAEVKFFWRRIITISWVVWNSILVSLVVLSPKMDATALMWVAIALIVSNVCMAFFYMAGASAVDMAKVAGGLAGMKPNRPTSVDEVI